jgi:hypothetical protein
MKKSSCKMKCWNVIFIEDGVERSVIVESEFLKKRVVDIIRDVHPDWKIKSVRIDRDSGLGIRS